MPNHTVTNATTSMLDMSPLCDLFGQKLTLRSQESRDVDDKTFNDDIVQRVIRAKWLTVTPQSIANAPEPAAPPETPETPVDAPETSAPAAPPEAPVVEASPEPEPEPEAALVPEAEPAAEAAIAPEIPVKTPVISERPLIEVAAQSGKGNKRR
jgi:hypothetical protein